MSTDEQRFVLDERTQVRSLIAIDSCYERYVRGLPRVVGVGLQCGDVFKHVACHAGQEITRDAYLKRLTRFEP